MMSFIHWQIDYFLERGFLSLCRRLSISNSFQSLSPMHCLAEAHHSIQEGVLSAVISVLHFGHLRRISSEKNSTPSLHLGHFLMLTRNPFSNPGHLFCIA